MAFLFGRQRQKSPPEVVRTIRDGLFRIEQVPTDRRRQLIEEVSKGVNHLKVILQDTSGEYAESLPELYKEVFDKDLLPVLVASLGRLDFETRKDVTAIFSTLLRRKTPWTTQELTVNYINNKPDLLMILIKGYDNKDIANNCGTMTRDAFKSEKLAKIALKSSVFWKFFDYIQGTSFDVASDAFNTFKELLSRHKDLVAGFLQAHFVKFFGLYNELLTSSNYVTKRQSIKLLGELLLDRANYQVMTRYVDSADNLKISMVLLRDSSNSIQYEAFHVFKVFVANPNKSPEVRAILTKNKEKLLVFLPQFQSERNDDDQFKDEKRFLITQIQRLGAPASHGTAHTQASHAPVQA